MINPSIFVYFPYERERNYSFLGFSKYEQEDKVTKESWEKIQRFILDKFFDTIKQKYKPCRCCDSYIQLCNDGIEMGLALKKLTQIKTLFEISMRKVNEVQQTIGECPQKKNIEMIKKHLSPNKKNIASNHFRHTELNEFAVKTLCEVSIESGIDKQTILDRVQKVRDDGCLSQDSFYRLQQIILTCSQC